MLIAPVLGDVLLERVGFRRTAGLFALVCLAPALAAALTVASAFPPAAAVRPEVPLEDHLFWAAAVAFLLYGPLENMLIVWAPSYLSGLGHSERRAAWLMTGFWVAFLAGRLLSAGLLQRGPLRPGLEAGAVVVLALLTAVALGNLAGTTNRGGAIGYLLLAGLCLGPVFPTLMGLVFERYPGERGTAFGLMFAAGGLGSALFVPLLGVYARRVTIQRAMRLPTMVALALAAAALVLGLSLPARR
jgi:fucose permease